MLAYRTGHNEELEYSRLTDAHAAELRTFLIADIRDYTRFAQEHGDESAARLASLFASLTRECVTVHGGEVVELRGDEALAAFGSARRALRTAHELQERFAAAMEEDASLHLHVGIGLDAGEVVPVEGGYRGRALNLASRLCKLARPGQVLASQGVIHLAGVVEGLVYSEVREVPIKGFAEPVAVIEVSSAGDVAAGVTLPAARAIWLSTLRIRLLGGLHVEVGTRAVEPEEWRLKKAAAIVKLLALEPGHRTHREQLIDLLWPEMDPSSAGNNLHHALHVARRILDPDGGRGSEYLRLQGEQVILHPSAEVWIDVEAFEHAASQARRTHETAAYEQAIDLYAGDLLPQDRYEDWVANRREGLRNTYHELLLGMARMEEAGGSYGSAIEALRRAVASDRTLEEAHLALMRLYARTGHRQGALRQFEHLRIALMEEQAADPAPASVQLHEEILRGRIPTASEGERGEAAIAGPPRHNLPAILTSFVGREDDLEEVEHLLNDARLLTLLGAGGSGKTRLGSAVAQRLVERYRDGVWLVELASVSEPSMVPQAVARILSVAEQPGRSLVDTVVDALRDRRLLLLLDNCDHVIEACAHLVEAVLGACPAVRVLATSREPLDVPGEITWLVPPLSLPADATPLHPAELARVESVRLFIERARYRQPNFELTAANAAAVAQICREVDGIPLAIELAAARIGVLSVEQIAARIVNALALLTGGGRSGLPHHQTLRATLSWSFDLLDTAERALFMRLSVFAGGWTLEQAEAVGDGALVPPESVLDTLSQLVDKSWVVAEAADGGTVRYRMLEPIRQYGREQLLRSDEPDEPAHRHAMLFLSMAEEAEEQLKGPNQTEWLRRLEWERVNLQAALGWLVGHGATEAAIRMALGLDRFWHIRAHAAEPTRWLNELMEQVTASVDPVLRSRLALAAGAHQETYERTMACYGRAYELAEQAGDVREMALALTNLAVGARLSGDAERLAQLQERSLELVRQLEDPWDRSYGLSGLAVLAFFLGDYTQAIGLFEETQTLARQAGDPRSLGAVTAWLGVIAFHQNDHERARTLLDEGVAICRENGDRGNLIQSLHTLGQLMLAEGRLDEAAGLLRETLVLASDAGAAGHVAMALCSVAGLALACGQVPSAVRLLGLVSAVYEAFGQPPFPAEGERLDGYAERARRRVGNATWTTAWAEGLAEARQSQSLALPGLAVLDRLISGSRAREEEPSEAASILSRREREVAVLVAEGLTNRQIAVRLSIAERTVDTHVGRILSKLGVGSRTQVAAWIMEQRLA